MTDLIAAARMFIETFRERGLHKQSLPAEYDTLEETVADLPPDAVVVSRALLTEIKMALHHIADLAAAAADPPTSMYHRMLAHKLRKAAGGA